MILHQDAAGEAIMPFTGNAEADVDIARFYAARQSLICRPVGFEAQAAAVPA